jgi:hypothetical protein
LARQSLKSPTKPEKTWKKGKDDLTKPETDAILQNRVFAKADRKGAHEDEPVV